MDAPDEVAEHVALVDRIAKQVASEFGAGRYVKDLVQSGWEGLSEAKAKFDANKAVPFPAFAYRRIRGAMIDFLRKDKRLTRSALERCRRAALVEGTLEQATEEVAERPPSGDMEATNEIDALLGKVTASYVTDVAASVERHGTEEGIVTALDAARVPKAIATLPELERFVIEKLYYEHQRLADIGAAKDRSEAWASRTHSAALGLLREALGEAR